MAIEFRILGPLEVVDDGATLELGGTTQRALLALFLLHLGERLSRDWLIEELWGARAPHGVANTLQVYVSRLRKLLGSDTITTWPDGYSLFAAPDQLDVHHFLALVRDAERVEPSVASERLRDALALWRGEPLADLAGKDFAQGEIRRLDELRAMALERWADNELELGNPVLTAELERLVARYPLRERFRAQLMIALYRADRQAEALEVYRASRSYFVEQLGLEPSELLRSLEQRILAQDTTLVPSGASPAPSSGCILVAAAHGRELELGAVLARGRRERELVLVRVLPPDSADHLAEENRALHELAEPFKAAGVSARTAAFTSQAVARDLGRLASQQDAALVLLGADDLGSNPLEPWMREALMLISSDVGLVVSHGAAAVAGGGVLVPFGAGHHDWAALELGAWLADAAGVPLRLLGAATSSGPESRDAGRLLADASIILQRCTGTTAEPVLRPPGPDGILAEAADDDVLVVGLSDRWELEGLGEVRSELARLASCPTIFVRRGPRPGGLAPEESRTQLTWSLADS